MDQVPKGELERALGAAQLSPSRAPGQSRGRDSVVQGAGFASQMFTRYTVTGEAEDRVVAEIAAEVDRLESLMPDLKAGAKAQASSRRLQALRQLYEVMNDRKDRQGHQGILATQAAMIRMFRQTLKDLELDSDLVETVIKNLIAKVETEEERGLA